MTEENMTDESLNILKHNLTEIVKEGVMLTILCRTLLMQIANAPDGKLSEKEIEAAKELLGNAFSNPDNFIATRITGDAMGKMEEMGFKF
jgi:uncharacterized tellurite resistance protein B-like protein